MNKFSIVLFLIIVSSIVSTPFTAKADLLMPSFSNDQVEALVRSTFANNPDMITIAKCESSFRQYTNNGMPLRGGGGGANIGVFQLNEPSHASTAQSLGYDIYTSEGNIAYAQYLFQKRGTAPWVSCLPSSSSTTNSAPTPTQSIPEASIPTSSPTTAIQGTLTTNLKLGMKNSQVLLLQQMLNTAGFTITTSGGGSPGNETTLFGQLTREAVKKFQCAKGIVCEGNESTTGYGYVGTRTRTALNSIIP